MSLSPDTADMEAPRDPAAYRRRRGLKAGAVVGFGLVCMIGGAGLATWAPKLLAQRPAARLAAAQATPLQPVTAAPAPVQPLPVPSVTPAASSADLQRLDARLSALEGQETRLARAASAALAAAAVMEASQGSRPFVEDLAALRAAVPAAPELAALTRLAETGAPSRMNLAASFPDYAARAAAAARRPGKDAGLGDRIVYALSQIVSLRRVGEAAGEGVDGKLAQAERRLEDGDVEGAVRGLDRLPPDARDVIGPWRAGAERRAEIDRLVGQLRSRALAELSR
jgi:hypothetical protein